MGNIDDILAKIDLTKGHWQVNMAEESKPMTAFIMQHGSFQFKRMLFGLVNSGSTFNRMMRIMLEGLDNVEHYVDDILIHTVTWEDHVKALDQILERIKAAELTVRPSKCKIEYS
jgi:hypothetical protein